MNIYHAWFYGVYLSGYATIIAPDAETAFELLKPEALKISKANGQLKPEVIKFIGKAEHTETPRCIIQWNGNY